MKKVVFMILAMVVALSVAACAGTPSRDGAVARYGEERVAAYEALQVGDSYTFGETEQDLNIFNGQEPIEWIVLAKEKDRALLLSRYVLDGDHWHGSSSDQWKTCDVKLWLNDEFLKLSFSEDEKSMLRENEDIGKVFLLSTAEVSTYLPTEEARKCSPSAYAAQYVPKGTYCWWWLRTPAEKFGTAACVYQDGTLSNYGMATNYGAFDPSAGTGDFLGIRPAVWISVYPETEVETETNDRREELYNRAMEDLRKGDYLNAYNRFRKVGRDYRDSDNYIAYTTALTNELYKAEPLLRSLPEDFENVRQYLTFIDNNRAWSGKTYSAKENIASINDKATVMFLHKNNGTGLQIVVSVFPGSHGQAPETFNTPYAPISLDTVLQDGYEVVTSSGSRVTLYADKAEFFGYFNEDCTFYAE